MSLRKSKQNHYVILGFLITCLFIHFTTFEVKFFLRFFNSSETRSEIISFQKIPEETVCQIPHVAPYSSLMKRHRKHKVPDIRCRPSDWVRCSLDVCVNTKTTIYKNISCEYSDILYVTDDKSVIGPPKTTFDDVPHHLIQSDFAKVRCQGINSKGKLRTWIGNVAGMRDIPAPKPKIKTEGKAYSIVINIFDSTSKNSFIRKMPLSYKVLKNKLNAIIMNGYNVVGGGTSNAFIPILTGHNQKELPDIRRSALNEDVHFPDELPLIWYLLRDAGYKTAYWEDTPSISIFNLYYYGFRIQPTDHYLQPYFMEFHRDGTMRKHCAGGMPMYRVLINLTTQLMQRQQSLNVLSPGNSTYFALTFFKDLSHDSVAKLAAADRRFAMFLRAMRSHRAFEDTVFIVMGDHGNRFSLLRRTRRGKMEERLPFLSFVLPPSFRDSKPEAVRAMLTNTKRLTTPYDLHTTLLEIAGLARFAVNVTLPGFRDRRRALSLLKPIPLTRSCGEAGIDPHWCTCLVWKRLNNTHPMFWRSAQAVVNHINHLIKDYRHLCVERRLWVINWVLTTKFRDNSSNSPTTYFQVKVVLNPSASLFEASIRYDEDQDKLRVRTKDISRLNRYNDEPRCIIKKKPDLRNFCFCYGYTRNMTEINEL